MASAPPSQSARFAGALEDPDAPASARLAGAASGVALRHWHFGRVVVPGPDYDWDDQLEGTRCRRGVVARPGIRTLVEWAETCLDTNPLGGWSPGRSIAVTVEYHDDTDDETLYYALFDNDLIQVKEVPGSTSAHGWPAPTLWGLVWDDFLTVLFSWSCSVSRLVWFSASPVAKSGSGTMICAWSSRLQCIALFRLQTLTMHAMSSSSIAGCITAGRSSGRPSCRTPKFFVCFQNWCSSTPRAHGVPGPPCCRLPEILRRHGAHGMPE